MDGLYTSLNLADNIENLFHQTVNLDVYEQLLKEQLAVQRAPRSTVGVQLSKDELNVLCGYVSMKLLKLNEKRRKMMGKKIEQF